MTRTDQRVRLRRAPHAGLLRAAAAALLALACGDDPDGPPPIESGDRQCCSCGGGCELTIDGDVVPIPVVLEHNPPTTPGGCVGCVGSSVCSSQSLPEQIATCTNICKGQALVEAQREFGQNFDFNDFTCDSAAPDPATLCTGGCDGSGSSTDTQLLARVVPSLSSATVATEDDDEPTQLGISGRVAVSALECPSGSCPFKLAFSFNTGGFIITVDGGLFGGDAEVRITAPQIDSEGALDGTLEADGTFEISGGSVLLRGLRDGQPGSKLLAVGSGISGQIDPATGAISLATSFDVTVKGLTLTFAFDVGAEAEDSAPRPLLSAPALVECGEPVLLDGSGTFDPDDDIVSARYVENLGQPGETSLRDPIANPGPLPLSAEVALAVGAHDIALLVVDGAGKIGVDRVQIESQDSAAPLIVLSPVETLSVCTPEAQLVTPPPASATDRCEPGSVVLQGALIEVNGSAVVPEIPLVGGAVKVPLGTHTIRWRAVDGHGHVAEVDDLFTVEEAQTPACCAPGQRQILGNDLPNAILPLVPGSYCVLARGGPDTVGMPAFATGNDYLAGGSGFDNLTAGFGNDVVVGGSGSDVIRGGNLGTLQAYGGAGGDQLVANLASSSLLHGGDGDDLIQGSLGPDVIYPGSGSDLVLALAGDDMVIMRHECEFESGEVVIDGGPGNDTLVAPLPQAALLALGVVAVGFESYVVDTSQRHLANCF